MIGLTGMTVILPVYIRGCKAARLQGCNNNMCFAAFACTLVLAQISIYKYLRRIYPYKDTYYVYLDTSYERSTVAG